MKHETFGWKTRIYRESGYFRLAINKIIARGIGLKNGSTVYCYLSKDKNNRHAFIVYLDGKPRRIKFDR